jgi:hypothetical protein
MILDVDKWVQELGRLRVNFREACTENCGFEIERSLYYSALLVRKFSETPFVRRGFLSPVIEGHQFSPAEGAVHGLNWTEAQAHFDFMHPVADRISLRGLCNILIHSRFLDWRPGVGRVQKIVAAGGVRAGIAAFEFDPLDYSSVLEGIESYKFKKLPIRPVKRTA